MSQRTIGIPSLEDFLPEKDLNPDEVVAGLYVLWHKDEAVYIGQSCDVYRRILQHRADPQKLFSTATFLPRAWAEDRLRAEGALILQYAPRYNRAVALHFCGGHVYEIDYADLFGAKKPRSKARGGARKRSTKARKAQHK